MKECLIISLILKVQWHEIFQERSKDRVKTKRLQYNCNTLKLSLIATKFFLLLNNFWIKM
jgi:hypothetical protein